MSVTINPGLPANNAVLLTNKTTSQFLSDEMGLALKSAVPTKTSDLVNDSDFTTKTELDTVNQNLTTAVLNM